MNTKTLAANYYQQFDADYDLDVPGEGYGGWKKADLEFPLDRMAVVMMHAWDGGTPEEFPGWYRSVEYIPRAAEIGQTVFPTLLDSVRQSSVPLFHVVGGGNYYKDCPGYKRAAELAGPEPEKPSRMDSDDITSNLRRFKSARSFVGAHNQEDVNRGFEAVDFMPGTIPLESEGVAENAHQLFALCRESNINHLVYTGFAINWCLLLSPGGMADMTKHGVMCSAIRQAVTAVENKETSRNEICKEVALWRVALAFGFVFDLNDFLAGIK
ncbi:MAG: hypothetical protein O3B01_04710 [Planctomycetota bacterium]|nr:hypothetical protein [Planctomycetota bacterium]MDA1137863.1 hypothetical protein [Planctomycetota bacterium]